MVTNRYRVTLANHDARRWEPKQPQHRLVSIPATLACTGRRVLLHLSDRAPWATLVCDAIHSLRALTGAG